MKRLLLVLLVSLSCVAQSSDNGKIWCLEHDYWRFVQAGDMTKYRALWHENFVGWPSSEPNPARKAHITDWYDNFVRQGLKLKSFEIDPLEFQVTGPVAVVHYRIRYLWVCRSCAIGQMDAARVSDFGTRLFFVFRPFRADVKFLPVGAHCEKNHSWR